MRTYTAILAATTLIGGIVATHLWTQLRAERERSDQLQERVTRLELAQAAPVRNVAAPSVLTGAGQQTSPVSTTGPATASTVAVASSARSGLASAINTRELLKDPDFREAMAPTVRASMVMMYPDLARELGLTPEQAGKLLDLITKHQMASMAMTAQSGYPDQAAMKEMSKAMQENSRKQDAEVSALLGEAKYQQWKEYQGTLGVRQQVSRLHEALESNGQPLEEYQEKSLIAALAADQKRQAEDGQRSPRTASTSGSCRPSRSPSKKAAAATPASCGTASPRLPAASRR